MFEVIVIDNCSTDHTYNIFKDSFVFHSNFHYFYESRIGLSNARNRGMDEARGDYIAYIDDDAIADKNWISEMAAFINKFPEAVVFGGPVKTFSIVRVPEWYPPEELEFLDLGEKDKIINLGKEWIVGGNIVFKIETLRFLGGFQDSLGMKGNKLCYGEETKVIIDLHKSGFQIYYASKMKVSHLINEAKLNLLWLLKSRYAVGRSLSQTFGINRSFLSCCKAFVLSIYQFLVNLFSVEPIPMKRRLYYSFEGFFYVAGIFVSYLVLQRKITLNI